MFLFCDQVVEAGEIGGANKPNASWDEETKPFYRGAFCSNAVHIVAQCSRCTLLMLPGNVWCGGVVHGRATSGPEAQAVPTRFPGRKQGSGQGDERRA